MSDVSFIKKLNDFFKNSARKKKEKSVLSKIKGKKCFAFDFGVYATKVAVGKIKNKNIIIKKLIEIENPNNQDALDLSNFDEWKNRIKRGLSKNHIMGLGHIALCSLGPKYYITKNIEIPAVDFQEDMYGLVSNEMSQMLSLNAEEYYFQYAELKQYEKEGKNFKTVRAEAIPRETCDLYYDLLDSLGFTPEALDISSNGIQRYIEIKTTEKVIEQSVETIDEEIEVIEESISEATTEAQSKTREEAKLNAQINQEKINEINTLKNETVAFLDYGFRGTEFSIYEKGIFVEDSNISCGDIKLVTAIKNVVGSAASSVYNGNKLDISETDVYNVLHDSEKYPLNHVFVEVVEELLSNINSVVKRYNANHTENPLSHLYLLGGSPQLVWLRVYLEKYLGVKTTIVSSSDNMLFASKIKNSEELFPKYFNALSLFLIQ